MKARSLILAFVLMLGSGAAQAAASDGWYTADQAAQGHQLFNNYCAECHRPDLTGAAGPALKGDVFNQHWGGKPLSDLYGFEHSKVPAVNPGSLQPDQYWTITAYILSKNGYPAGAAALNANTAKGKVLQKQ